MRRRLDLAASLIGDPEVIFLDEPTTGLDPRSRQAMWALVTALARSGVTVLLTTQQLEEADHLADRIAVLDGGRIVAEGTAEELKRRVGGERLDLRLCDVEAFDRLTGRLGARAMYSDRATLSVGIATDGAAAGVRALLDELDPDGTRIERFSLHTASLDDVFMTLTGHHTDPTTTTTESEPANV
jgi:ABC-2 type transport system ATP-binding protein